MHKCVKCEVYLHGQDSKWKNNYKVADFTILMSEKLNLQWDIYTYKYTKIFYV